MKQINEALNDLSYQVIGAAMEVHRQLGAGLLESVYEEALCVELGLRNIPFERQKAVNLEYKGHSIGDMRVDILVDSKIILELKAIEKMLPVHQAQIMTYMKLLNIRLGLLINFNSSILKNGIKRIAL